MLRVRLGAAHCPFEWKEVSEDLGRSSDDAILKPKDCFTDSTYAPNSLKVSFEAGKLTRDTFLPAWNSSESAPRAPLVESTLQPFCISFRVARDVLVVDLISPAIGSARSLAEGCRSRDKVRSDRAFPRRLGCLPPLRSKAVAMKQASKRGEREDVGPPLSVACLRAGD